MTTELPDLNFRGQWSMANSCWKILELPDINAVVALSELPQTLMPFGVS